jgi:hypothetical protein
LAASPCRQHIELQCADDTDDPVAAGKRLEDACIPVARYKLQ